MKKGKTVITVSGEAMSGKSHLIFLLKKCLQENGFDVKHEVSLDYQDEDDFERQIDQSFYKVIDHIKEQREIIIKEEQEIEKL